MLWPVSGMARACGRGLAALAVAAACAAASAGEAERRLVVVNLGEVRSQALVRVPWRDLATRIWRLVDALDGTVRDRSGADMAGPGLFVELEAGAWHLFSVS